MTFPNDLTDPDVIGDEVSMARELRAEIKADGRPVTHIAVTVRTRSFFTPSQSGRLLEVTTDPQIVEARARAVLARFVLIRPVRLLASVCGWIWQWADARQIVRSPIELARASRFAAAR